MTTTPDGFGNRRAQEGVDRCPCGAKYWENDTCVSCGEPFRIYIEHEDDVCAGGVCQDILRLCSKHSMEYQMRYGRASNE